MQLDPELARTLFHQGAFLVLMESPNNLEFGVDLNEWKTGPKFKGLKLIPPGLHFFFYSAKGGEGGSFSARTGMFKYFAPKEVAVKRWDPSTEDFLDEDKLDSSYVSGLQNALEQLDPNLGAYPFLPTPDLPEPNYQKWIRLTSNITPDVLKKVLPKSGKVNSGLSGSRFSDFGDVMQRKSTEQMILDSHDAYLINFTVIDLKRSFPVNSSPDQIMKYSLDKSFLLRSILNLEYKNDYKMLLGELQLAFLLLLVGQVYDGLEQWKTIIQLLSNSPEAMSQYDVPLFSDLLGVINDQLRECPDDFFSDVLSSDNFLMSCLVRLLCNMEESLELSSRTIKAAANEESLKIKQTLRTRFKTDINAEIRRYLEEKEDEEEYAPVSVEFET